MTLFELLKDLDIPTAPSDHHHCTPTRIQIDCPYCSPGSKKWRMGIHKRLFSASCWVCGAHRFLESLSLASGVSQVELSESVVGHLTLDSAIAFAGQKRPAKAMLPNGRGELLPAHRRFLARKGFDPDEITRLWKVQGIGTHHRYGWRLFIPAFLNGQIVSWTTRAVGNDPARYKSAPADCESVSIKEVLYGAEMCVHGVVVNEGALDAWAIGEGGVATMGVGYSEAQMLQIARYPIRIVCFDSEPDAQRRALELCRELACFPGETHNVVLSGKDASRSPKSEIQLLRKMLC